MTAFEGIDKSSFVDRVYEETLALVLDDSDAYFSGYHEETDRCGDCTVEGGWDSYRISQLLNTVAEGILDELCHIATVKYVNCDNSAIDREKFLFSLNLDSNRVISEAQDLLADEALYRRDPLRYFGMSQQDFL